MHGASGAGTTSGKLYWHGDAITQPDWLVKWLLPQTGVALLSGQRSTGKTFIALHLAYCLATGEPFAEQKIKRRGGTLFLAAEAAGDIQFRLRVFDLPPGSTGQGRLPFAYTDEVPKLTDKNALNRLIALAGKADADMQQKFGTHLALIVVDTISAAAGFDDENSAAEVQRVMDVLQTLARKTGALVLAIDHRAMRGSW